jgi:hypothetical protein
VEGGGALRPVGGAGGVLGAPIGPLGSLDRVLGKAVHQVLGEPTNDVAPRPVAHAVDPDDEPAGGEAAEVIVALDQEDIGAEARGGDGRSRPGWTAADHQHVGLREHWDLASGLEVGPGGSLAPRRLAAAERLEALLGADAGAVVAGRPGAVLEDLGLVEAPPARIGTLIVRHTFFPSARRRGGARLARAQAESIRTSPVRRHRCNDARREQGRTPDVHHERRIADLGWPAPRRCAGPRSKSPGPTQKAAARAQQAAITLPPTHRLAGVPESSMLLERNLEFCRRGRGSRIRRDPAGGT